MATIKKTKRVLGAKVRVTKSDAKKLRPLTKYWTKRILAAKFSDNEQIRMEGFVIGAVTVMIAAFIVVGL